MTKEFEIDDILKAVNSISKMERRKTKAIKTKNDSVDMDAVSHPNKQVKSNKSEILVLDQMIE